jgi:hypothetical protein
MADRAREPRLAARPTGGPEVVMREPVKLVVDDHDERVARRGISGKCSERLYNPGP